MGDGYITLSATFDVVPAVAVEERDAAYRRLRDDLKLYRHLCRKYYGVYMFAAAAGAKVSEHEKKGLQIKDDSAETKKILADAFEMRKEDGEFFKAKGYEFYKDLRSQTKDTYLAEFACYVIQTIGSTWKAKDPEFTRAGRGWLNLQSARDPARFNHVPLPIHPKRVSLSDNARTISLHYRTAGPTLFRLVKMDGGRWHTWKQIATGEWPAKTAYLHERDGRFFIRVSYQRTVEKVELDKARSLSVEFTENEKEFCVCWLHEGKKTATDDMRNEKFSATAALAELDRIFASSAWADECRKACGNRRHGNAKALRKEKEIQERLTARRTGLVKNWNHCWSKRIVETAVRFRAGKILVVGLPSKILFGRPWNWGQFEIGIKYKSELRGIEVEKKELEKVKA